MLVEELEGPTEVPQPPASTAGGAGSGAVAGHCYALTLAQELEELHPAGGCRDSEELHPV